VRKAVVALLVVAIAGVAGFGVWANREDEPRFCQAGAYIMGTVPGLEGYSVTLQDSDTPGPDDCDGPDRPEVYEEGPAEDLGDPAPGAAPTTTMLPQAPVPDEDEPVLEPLVLGLDCKYRDDDGEVVATAVPNRPDGECGLPEPGGRQPGELAGPPTRPPR